MQAECATTDQRCRTQPRLRHFNSRGILSAFSSIALNAIPMRGDLYIENPSTRSAGGPRTRLSKSRSLRGASGFLIYECGFA